MELKSGRKYQRISERLLLIVPYGIEINVQFFVFSDIHLLIVPYGIEIHKKPESPVCGNSFNRTLWN